MIQCDTIQCHTMLKVYKKMRVKRMGNIEWTPCLIHGYGLTLRHHLTLVPVRSARADSEVSQGRIIPFFSRRAHLRSRAQQMGPVYIWGQRWEKLQGHRYTEKIALVNAQS